MTTRWNTSRLSRARRLKVALLCATFGAAGLGLAGTALAGSGGEENAVIASAGDDAGERVERRARHRERKAQLSPEERRAMMLERKERMFERMDRDGDGRITWDEFWASTLERHERRAERRQARGDRGEARAERRQGRRGPHDGQNLSPEERRERMLAHAERRFERLDADGDGAITWEEFEAAREHRGKRGKRGKGGAAR
jgi:hypothetical protein